jgi:hypothetical protein
MTPTTSTDPIRKTLATALLLFPSVFGLVFIMHFRRFSDFLKFQTHYVPASPERVVSYLIAHHNDRPLMHDPHMIGYLALPVFPLCAFALYLLGRRTRPLVSAVGMMITITGSIYMGGAFGMWTAFFRGLGLVDSSHLAGATATFAAMTAPQGAFLVTTTLAKLTMIGLATQALTLLGAKVAPLWSTVSIVAGCVLFLLFWDLNNWMLIASVLMLIGFVPLRKSLLQQTDDESANPGK